MNARDTGWIEIHESKENLILEEKNEENDFNYDELRLKENKLKVGDMVYFIPSQCQAIIKTVNKPKNKSKNKITFNLKHKSQQQPNKIIKHKKIHQIKIISKNPNYIISNYISIMDNKLFVKPTKGKSSHV